MNVNISKDKLDNIIWMGTVFGFAVGVIVGILYERFAW